MSRSLFTSFLSPIAIAFGASVVIHSAAIAVSLVGTAESPVVRVKHGRTSVQLVTQETAASDASAVKTPTSEVPPVEIQNAETHADATREPPPAMPIRRKPTPLKSASKPVGAEVATFVKSPQPAEDQQPVKLKQQASVESTASSRTPAVVGAPDQLPFELPGNPPPQYPTDALQAGQEGIVKLRCEIQSDGSVGRISIHRTSGNSSLDNVALSTVKLWRFVPAKRKATAIPYTIVVPIEFTIRK